MDRYDNGSRRTSVGIFVPDRETHVLGLVMSTATTERFVCMLDLLRRAILMASAGPQKKKVLIDTKAGGAIRDR